jgi:hypothetical protein
LEESGGETMRGHNEREVLGVDDVNLLTPLLGNG